MQVLGTLTFFLVKEMVASAPMSLLKFSVGVQKLRLIFKCHDNNINKIILMGIVT